MKSIAHVLPPRHRLSLGPACENKLDHTHTYVGETPNINHDVSRNYKNNHVQIEIMRFLPISQQQLCLNKIE